MRDRVRSWASIILVAPMWTASPLGAQADTTRKRPVPVIPDVVIDLPPVTASRPAPAPRPCAWGRVTYSKVRDVWEISLDSLRFTYTNIFLSLSEHRAGVKRAFAGRSATMTLTYLGRGPQLRFVHPLGMHLLIDDSVRFQVAFPDPLTEILDERTLRIASATVPIAVLERIGKARRVDLELEDNALSLTEDQVRSIAGFLARRRAPLTVGPYYSCAFAP